jgi:hypothetical protein
MKQIRVSEEVYEGLRGRKHTGQSFDGMLREMLSGGVRVVEPVRVPIKVEPKVVSKVPDRCLDSLVLEFRDEGNRKVVSEPGWVKAIEWAVSWWEGKI